MSDFTLKYVGYHAEIETLNVNECTIRPASEIGTTAIYPRLWFYVLDDEGQELDVLSVPIAPSGAYTESGIGGRTWAFTRSGGGVWLVSPSINVLPHPQGSGKLIHAGEHPSIKTSSWHHTPQVVGVPDGEPWQ